MPARDAIKVGALLPQSEPGWVEAGLHLRTGLELAAYEANAVGGIHGRRIELLVRDTSGNPQAASTAVEDLARGGAVAIVGEYHSVVARAAAAKADCIGLPFLCSSAVLDALVEQPSDWIARIAPAQSESWRIYADFLLAAGHRRIAVAAASSAYWQAGISILRNQLGSVGGSVMPLDMDRLSVGTMRDRLIASDVTALLLLVGFPQPAVSIVRAVRNEPRLAGILIGAPAGQSELNAWHELLGVDGAAIPFLRYLPESFGALGNRVKAALHNRLGQTPSFVAFEGYDTMLVLTEILRSAGTDRRKIAESFAAISVEGTRGCIRFSRPAGINIWQWAWPPIQVATRDPEDPGRIRLLYRDERSPI